MTGPKYPQVVVEMVGVDGNAFTILAAVRKALRQNGVPEAEVSEFVAEATSGNYDHLLATVAEWVNVA